MRGDGFEVVRVRTAMDVVKQLLYIVKDCKSVDEVVEKLQRILDKLEPYYDALLQERDPLIATIMEVKTGVAPAPR